MQRKGTTGPRRHLRLILTTLATLAVVMAPAAAYATAPGANGRIAFSQGDLLPEGDVSIHSDIFTILPNGSGLRQLTHVPEGQTAGSPDWSPDGSSIAFERTGADGGFEIWTMNADGSGRTRLTHDPRFDDFQPSWSPDGESIVFSRCDRPFGFTVSCEIELMRADGSERTKLTRGHWLNVRPAFSPDGEWIAFGSTRGGFQNAIWRMRVDGSQLSRLTSPELRAFWPDWAPDGRHIVFTDNCCNPGPSNVWTMRPDGSGLKRLTDFGPLPLQGGFASYSPNGRKIVLIYNGECPDGPCHDFYTMRADGSGLQRVGTGVENTFLTDWGPRR